MDVVSLFIAGDFYSNPHGGSKYESHAFFTLPQANDKVMMNEIGPYYAWESRVMNSSKRASGKTEALFAQSNKR